MKKFFELHEARALEEVSHPADGWRGVRQRAALCSVPGRLARCHPSRLSVSAGTLQRRQQASREQRAAARENGSSTADPMSCPEPFILRQVTMEAPSHNGSLQVRLATTQWMFRVKIYSSNLEPVLAYCEALRKVLNLPDFRFRNRWQCSRKRTKSSNKLGTGFLDDTELSFQYALPNIQKRNKKRKIKHSQMLWCYSQQGNPAEFRWLSEATSAYKKTESWQCLTCVSTPLCYTTYSFLSMQNSFPELATWAKHQVYHVWWQAQSKCTYWLGWKGF